MATTIPKNDIISSELKCIALAAITISAFALFPEFAEAATTAAGNVKGDKELGVALKTVTGLVSGTVGKIISITAFMFGLTASIFKFNTPAIVGSFATALAASLGPGAIEAVVGATF